MRDIIVVDGETSGLDPRGHRLVEVAWRNLFSGEHGWFVPHHSVEWVLENGEPKALEINHYRERLAGAPQDDGSAVGDLHGLLTGATVAGSNPAFDTAFLPGMFEDAGLDGVTPWHHRLLDLSAYAAGVLGVHPSALPGLSSVCDWLGVENRAPHTAMGDADATAECFLALMRRAGVAP